MSSKIVVMMFAATCALFSACSGKSASTASVKDFAEEQWCGAVSANTQVCVDRDWTHFSLANTSARADSTELVMSDSATSPGFTAYTGLIDLSFVAGFQGATQVSLLGQADGNGNYIAKLLYLSTQGWTAWPNQLNESTFTLSKVVQMPCCKSIN